MFYGPIFVLLFLAGVGSVSALSCYACVWTDDPDETSLAECETGNFSMNNLPLYYFKDTLQLPKETSGNQGSRNDVETIPYYSHCLTMTGTLYGYRFVFRRGHALREYSAKDGTCETTFDEEDWDFLYQSGVIGMSVESMKNFNSQRMCYCKGDGCNSSQGLKALSVTAMITIVALIVKLGI